MKVNYVILPDSLVVNFEGQTHPVAKGDGRYQAILEAIKAGKLDKIPDLVDTTKHFSKVKGLEVKGGNVYLDGQALEGVIADRILKFRDEQLPYEPLIKFARKLRLNPSFNSRAMLYRFLEHNGHPITVDGNFIAYRGVTKEFKDKHTGKFDNSVGAICEMDRAEVDENPNNTCSSGLHVACYEYAKGFAPQLIEVEVDPQDVVAVPTDYNGTKMRVCRFKVVNVAKDVRSESLYTDSEHVAQLDDSDELIDDETCDNCGDSNPYGGDCGNCGGESEDEENESDQDTWEILQLKRSSVVASAQYNHETMELEVKLVDGGTYVYSDVPESVTFEWEDAPSVGSYYVNFIAHSYDYVQQ